MAIQVELTPETEARLAAEAQLRGIALEKYASRLLQEALTATFSKVSTGKAGHLTLDELDTMLRQISDGSDKLPQLATSAFTRESFYEDRH
ncbi:MAG TPA: hypothetical protein VE178_00770 [Silvibacterium sp.]|jgi:hypothetical protein|nr:hypothetical protein [Silvibacterium sp.]